ncbi:MAG: saccharopine dehydrogenase C-terminal domain-containing protein [Burkholderiaceae bacterium]
MIKRIGLIGCGNLGYPLAYYLGQLGFDELCVHDLDREKAVKLKQDMAEVCPSLYVKDQLDTGGLDVVVLSLSGPATIAFVSDPRNHALFKDRRVFVSLGRPNYEDLAAHQALDRYLVENGISLLFGFGLEPGLVEVLMHHLASVHEDALTSMSAVCGGVPQYPNPPLNYDLLFGDRLPALNRKALFKADGNLGSCKRFDMKETRFVDGVGVVEVYHDGLSPYLLSSRRMQVIPDVRQQTARWPGFFDCMRVLLSLGLLDEQIMPDGAAPSDLTHAILRQNGNLMRNRPDISFVEVVAQLKSGEHISVSVVSTFDERAKLTGMAQLTSFMATWAARQVADLVEPCPPGLILSHEFFDDGKISALLDAFQKHTRSAVITPSTTT